MYCDYCECNMCKYGDGMSEHAKTAGDWICDTCWNYDICGDQPCDDLECIHRPKLVSDFIKE